MHRKWYDAQEVAAPGSEMGYLEVRCTYNLRSDCSYNPVISRVTVLIGFITGL